MRVLVTGAAGFVGGHVARYLAAEGHDVVGTFRGDSWPKDNGYGVWQGDLTDSDAKYPARCEVIVHCAATHPVSGASLERTIRDNVPAMLNLLLMARWWEIKAFVLLSSISVHGKVHEPVLNEQTPRTNPDAYGSTKYLCECALMEQPFASLSLRLPGVIGPGAHLRNWLPGIAAKLLRGDTINAYGLDGFFNNVVHVHDVAAFVGRVIPTLAGGKGHDAVILGAGGVITVREAIERLAKAMGNMTVNWSSVSMDRRNFTLSSDRAISKWRYDPMEIGAMIDRYGREFMAQEGAKA